MKLMEVIQLSVHHSHIKLLHANILIGSDKVGELAQKVTSTKNKKHN